MNNERYRLPGHCSPLSHALLLPGVMEEERGESGFGPHSVYQLDGPGPAVHAMGHVKYEEESQNKNILKYLLYSIEYCVILKCIVENLNLGTFYDTELNSDMF